MHFGVNKVFHSGLVLLFSIEHIIVPFNQIVQIVMPQRRCQISFQILDKLLRNRSLSPKRFAPMKAIMITGTYPTKIMHNESGPPPSSLGLNAIP